MKKVFFFVTAVFALMLWGKSQNTSPYWSLAGNSNANAASKLGTTNGTSLRFYTNDVQRMIINSAAGYVGIGNSSPVNILTVQSSGGIPAASWLNGLNSPVFAGFGEVVSSEFLLAGASNTAINRAVFQGRRSRGTLAAPAAVVNNDYLTSLLASGYDGGTFQNPALVSFFVDGAPSAGHVPARISFVTGTNVGDRVERVKIGSTGNIDFNSGQVYLQHSTGNLGIGTSSPTDRLHVVGTSLFAGNLSVSTGGVTSTNSGTAVYGNSTGGSYGVWGNSTYLGVYGTGTTYGLYGSAGSSGYGVLGTSGYIGVYGSGSSYGLYGSGGTYGAYGSGTSYGVYGNSSAGYGIRGVSSSSYGVYGSSGYLGVYGVGDSYGVYGYSASSYGVYGTSGYLGVYGTGTSYGVYGYSSAGYGTTGISSTNYGVYGESGSGNGGRFYSATGYGLWAATGRADNNWAGVFDGNVYCYNAYQTSDKNLKKNIQDFGDAMSIINKLKPKNYEFKTEDKYASLNLPRGNHYGLIAQDLELVLPELVKESVHDLNFAKTRKEIKPSGDGKEPTGTVQKEEQKDEKDNITIKAINYTELIPIIVKGMQELYADRDKKINDLQSQINDLKALVQSLSHGGVNTTNLTTAFLKQNTPNPFNNNTIISYYIPDNAGYAQIKITDIKGSVIKTFNASKGQGQINIRSGELPAGTYNYSLYIGNKTVDTKQMVLVK